jgi:hypothetical protein
LPEERIQKYCAEETNDESPESGWDDDFYDRDSLCDEQVQRNGTYQNGQLRSEYNSSYGDKVEAQAITLVPGPGHGGCIE